jgi:hypothetical protein
MQVGDLVVIKASDDGLIYGTGIYLGVKTTWKDWHMVHLIYPWFLQGSDLQGSPFDEPYRKLEVINNKNEH